MGPTDIPRPPSRFQSFLRYGLPLLIIVLAGAAIGLVRLWPSDEFLLVFRNFTSILVVLLALLLLLGWLLAFSGLRWWMRIAVPLVAVAALGAMVAPDVSCTGDMLPRVHFRWQPSGSDAVVAYYRGHPDRVTEGPADLAEEHATDFPGYRGAQRDGVVFGPALLRSWSQPPQALWRHPVGGGYAGFAVAGSGVVTIEQRGGDEAVVCYDRATGKQRWVYQYPDEFQERMGGNGPRATPTIAGGDVFALGAKGRLCCLVGSTGVLKWEVTILDDKDGHNIPWGMSGSPLVYDDVVVVNPGAQGDAAKAQKRAVVAYDRETGRPVWSAGEHRASYSSPMLATLAGKRQVLIYDANGVAGYDADGKDGELWRHEWKNSQQINVAQPIVLPGDRVFISAAYGTASAMLQVSRDRDQWAIKELWQNMKMQSRFTNPVAYQEHLYGLDEGVLACLDAKDGSRNWKGERYGHGQLLLAGDVLVVLAEDGELALVEATPEAFHELGRFQALEGHTWNYPALADGKAYVRNDREMACYDLAR
jgi:outer membrane protein assembly factor BamB